MLLTPAEGGGLATRLSRWKAEDSDTERRTDGARRAHYSELHVGSRGRNAEKNRN